MPVPTSKKRSLFSVFTVLVLGAAVVTAAVCPGCGQSPEDARRRLEQAGLPCSRQAFIRSITVGDARAVELFLAAGLEPDAAAFQEAVLRNLAAVLPTLLAHGADPNAGLDDHDTTALMLAVSLGRADLVKILLDAGADPDLQNLSGRTALIIAVIQGRTDMVRTLSASGADPGIKDHQGWTAWDYARALDNQSIKRALEN